MVFSPFLLPSLEGPGVGSSPLLPSLEGPGVGSSPLLPSLEGPGVGSSPLLPSYRIVCPIWKMGNSMAKMIKPTTSPINRIRMGSRRVVTRRKSRSSSRW